MQDMNSSSSMNYTQSVALMEDIILNILSRIPVKPVTRFKCVCKRWCSLISDPQFAKLQLEQSLKQETGHRIIKNRYLQTIYLEEEDDDAVVLLRHYPTSDLEDEFIFIGSCNGLVCLSVYDDESNRYLLYNPTTRVVRYIPASCLYAEYNAYELFSGLGYDPSTDDYKVICGILRHDVAEVDIFSRKTNSWRRRIVQRNSSSGFIWSKGIYLNGSLHWFSTNNKGKNSIVSFNLKEEEFKEETPMMPNNVIMQLARGLGFIGGGLFVYNSSIRAEAWIMKEYGTKQLFSVDMSDKFPEIPYYVKPLTCSRSGKKIVFDVDGREMLLFNTLDGTLEEIATGDYDDFETMVYVESLVSPY